MGADNIRDREGVNVGRENDLSIVIGLASQNDSSQLEEPTTSSPKDVDMISRDVNGASAQPEVPYVGMIISTVEEAYSLYNTYARFMGFGIRRSSSNKNTSGVKNKCFVCNKEGRSDNYRKSVKDNANVGVCTAKRTRRDGCKARLRVIKEDDHWRVSRFNDKHTHEMSTPNQAERQYSHRRGHLFEAARATSGTLVSQSAPNPIVATMLAIGGNDTDKVVSSHNVPTHHGSEHLRTVRENNRRKNQMESNLVGSDKLVLRGLKFHGYHGVLNEEKILGQKFLVDLDVWLDLAKACETDDVKDTVSYAEIYNLAKGVVEGTPHNLLESLAGKIVREVFAAYAAISAILVKIGKPHVAVQGTLDYLGVEIFRSRVHAKSDPL